MDTEQMKASPGTAGSTENPEVEKQEPTEKTEEQKEGKEETVFHEDIVVTENERQYGDALRRLLHIPDSEGLANLQEKIEDYEKSVEQKLAAAKNQVIDAELKAMSGYDTKLLSRLLDRSALSFDDSGKVKGLEEAVKQIAAEFPAVVLPKEKKQFVPMGTGAEEEAKPTMNDLIRGKR